MSDDKTTPKISDQPELDAPLDPVAVSPVPKEPKKPSAKASGAKPAKAKIAHNAVVGTGDTDTVVYSKARVPGRNEGRKSLTVLHIQRRLADEGFPEASSAPGGQYEALTTSAVRNYQASIGADITGLLTREQFKELFADDPNVTVILDTHYDHG